MSQAQLIQHQMLYTTNRPDISRLSRILQLRVPFPSLFLFPALLVYSMSLTTGLVVCNQCYGGFLVAVSCNSFSVNETCAKTRVWKKNHIWAQQSAFGKQQLPGNLSETKFHLSPVTEATLSKVRKSSLTWCWHMRWMQTTLSIQFLFLVLVVSTLCLPVIMTSSLTLETELILFLSAHVAITEDSSQVAPRLAEDLHWLEIWTLVSSIGDNALGGWHSYRASKTALNRCKWTRRCSISCSHFFSCGCFCCFEFSRL